jgi:hypothetical protein
MTHPLFVSDTYRGIPVDPIAASVIRDAEREKARRDAGLSQADVQEQTREAFESWTKPMKGAPGMTAAVAASLERVATAGSLAEAIDRAAAIPEARAMAAAQGGFPLFQRVKELRPWSLAGAMAGNGMSQHYANHVELLLGSTGDLRLRVTRHFAGSADYGSRWVHEIERPFDNPYSSSVWAVFSAGPSKVAEFFPKLTPAVLADYLRQTLSTGRAPVAKS